MGLYRINNANSVFPGKRGDRFITQDGPYLRAAVRAGAVSRLDSEPEPPNPTPELVKQPEIPTEDTEPEPDGETTPASDEKKSKKGK